MFSRDYNYACYLVFKLEDGDVLSNDLTVFEVNFLSDYKMDGNVITIRITLKTRKEESGSSNHNYMDWERSWVEKRDDGWLEVRLTKPLLKHHLETLTKLKINLWESESESFNGMIVEGLQFRPVVVEQ
ncbi:serine-threonine/tyrosine-protein kinase catalytic domain-containing protein [Tanacetum coccineum]|uniref:Serine-threonine/tyrosine-protein kinase catalytic domain-containing protein n=1 Tax=Tanacetum coccineum TaxID=301880 RepID=A0ABQ5DRY6_9ASTR